MALVKLTGLPIIPLGYANRQGTASISALGSVTLDAANEAAIMIGHLYWEDGGSHTVDTTGSSSIQWRTGAVTFADAGTTFKVGIAEVDATAGPPGRAVNVADVITNDVAAVFTGGGGGVTANAWQTSVPTTGTKTIASGANIAVTFQITAYGGADSILVSAEAGIAGVTTPSVTSFTGGSYANSTRVPNAVLVASDGTRGYIYGGYVASVGATAQSWNNGSATKEYGNILRVADPMRAYGIIVGCNFVGNTDLILYSDPLGTPVAERTISVDLNTIGTSLSASDGRFLFTAAQGPFDLIAATDYAVIAKPTSVTSISMNYKTFNDANHQNSEVLGTDCYAVNRDTGAFASQNSNKDRFAIGILVGAFSDGSGGGGAHVIGGGV